MVTSQGARNRARGSQSERAVVNWLKANGWPDTRRYLAGDGRQPGDIDWSPLVCLEVKDRAQSAWPTWCRQAAREARTGMVPAVVRRTRGVRDVGRWQTMVPVDRWVLDFGRSAGDGTAVVGVAGYGPWLVMPFGELVRAVATADGRPHPW